MASPLSRNQTFHGLRKRSVSSPFEALFIHATTGILILDQGGKIVAANPYLLHMSGYQEKELVGDDFKVLLPQRVRKSHGRNFKRFLKDPGRFSVNAGARVYARRKSGKIFPVEVNLSHYKSFDSGENFAFVFVRDISARREAESRIRRLNVELRSKTADATRNLAATIEKLEQQVRETNEADSSLREANSYLNNLLDHAGVMIVATDLEGTIRLFNPQSEKTLGYHAGEVIAKHRPGLFLDPSEVREKAEKLSIEVEEEADPCLAIFRSQAKPTRPYTSEWECIRKDGGKVPISLTVTELVDEDREAIGFMGIGFDISDRRKAELDLRSALEKERELSELKSKFVSLASHEFRTPLSTILSSAYLISKYTASADQSKRELHLHRIISSVNMLTDTLNDFLSVGKIEEGKIQAKLTSFNIHDSIAGAIAEWGDANLRKGQQLTYTHDGDPLVVMDVSLLKHILLNLLSNASKFSHEGSRIEVATVTTDSATILSVKDDGIGISDEDQKHLAERFFRGLNASNTQGTGLGLHIVSKYAELMNGTIECHSQLNKGTEFIISFKKNLAI